MFDLLNDDLTKEQMNQIKSEILASNDPVEVERMLGVLEAVREEGFRLMEIYPDNKKLERNVALVAETAMVCLLELCF